MFLIACVPWRACGTLQCPDEIMHRQLPAGKTDRSIDRSIGVSSDQYLLSHFILCFFFYVFAKPSILSIDRRKGRPFPVLLSFNADRLLMAGPRYFRDVRTHRRISMNRGGQPSLLLRYYR